MDRFALSCDILGVPLTASETQVKATFIQLSIEYHQIQNKLPEDKEKFKQISKAHKWLIKHIQAKYWGETLIDTSWRGRVGRHAPAKPVPKKSWLPKNPPLNYTVTVTLNEIMHGTVKEMHITRLVTLKSGRQMEQPVKLSVPIKPGIERGRQIIIRNRGHCKPNTIPGDVIFTVAQLPDPNFTRFNNVNLRCTYVVDFFESLKAKNTFWINTLDGVECLRVNGIIASPFKMRIPDKGLPYAKNPRKLGDLVVKFQIKYPDEWTPDNRRELAESLLYKLPR